MAQSMTGFGVAEKDVDGVRVSVEARSVNHRFIEVGIKSSYKSLSLEDQVRKKVKALFSRGAFDIFISVGYADLAANVKLNEPLLKGYLKAAADMSEKYGIPYPPTFGDMASIRDMFAVAGEETRREALEPAAISALEEALGKLAAMRGAEGGHIAADMTERLGRIAAWTGEIKEINERAVPERLATLKEKIAKLVGDAAIDAGRLAQEAALLAERSDISEEITRLTSHLEKGRQTIEGPGPIGRKLEFLLQEFGREANTIGAKSFSPEITRLALEIKGELEKLREQTQNLE